MDEYGNTPMENARAALCEALSADLTLAEVLELSLNARNTTDFLEAVSLYSMHDIDVTGFAPMIVLE